MGCFTQLPFRICWGPGLRQSLHFSLDHPSPVELPMTVTIFPSPSPCHQFFLLIFSVKGNCYTICLLGLKDLESLLLQADAWQDKADAWQDKEWWLFLSLAAAVLLSVAVPESGFESGSFPFFQRDRVWMQIVCFPHPNGSCLIQTASRQQARRAETELMVWNEPCLGDLSDSSAQSCSARQL